MNCRTVWIWHLAALATLARRCYGGYVPPTKYLIVSNARNGSIGYVPLSRAGNYTEARVLIDKDLIHPQGIAVDHKRQLLLVADSELKKVVSYGLILHEDGSLGVDEQTPLAEDIETRWVAVDGQGNVYMTDEQNGKIMRISARQVLDGDTTPTSLFSDRGNGDDGAISAPGGIATDNFHVYWTNKQEGQSLGTVVKALAGPLNSTGIALQPRIIAKNLPKAYGVCMALDSIYFTDTDHNVFAVKASGGEPMKVSSRLANPRGCAWDGEDTVFIADRSADAVFSLKGPSMSLAEGRLEKAVNYEGAFGVAIFSSAWRSAAGGSWLVAVAAALVGRWHISGGGM
mmetsp:Transcript_15899/g.45291  ORF Transcript_15899/g.45291 Transcript_15899/m.45291 type:complete len:343 (+) Transcript_15899:135-1163(+)